MDRIQILATLNESYLPRLEVLLTSIFINQPDDPADIWLMHSGIPDEKFQPAEALCRMYGFGFYPVAIGTSAFKGAPISRQYPREMYYRLLASHLLPDRIHRIIYLDPDILVINSLRLLWETDMKGCRPHRNDRACKQHQPAPSRHGSQLLQFRGSAHGS